ncbi:MAG: hypothetical protein ACK53Y_22835, partial [bacterium]
IRLARSFHTQATRFKQKLQALIAALYAYPTHEMLSGYIQAQPELCSEIADLCPPTSGQRFGELGVAKGQYTGLLPMLIRFIVASFSASESKTLRILKNDYEIDKNFLDDDELAIVMAFLLSWKQHVLSQLRNPCWRSILLNLLKLFCR